MAQNKVDTKGSSDEERQLGAALALIADKVAASVAPRIAATDERTLADAVAARLGSTMPRNTRDWYRTWAAGAALAISSGLLFSLRSLSFDRLTPLAEEKKTFFTQTAEWIGIRLGSANHVVAAIQWVTILFFAVAGIVFVWEKADILAAKTSRVRVLFEAGVYFCAAFCSFSCTSDVWVFRAVFAIGTAFWILRLLIDIDDYKDTLALYGLCYLITSFIILIVGFSGHPLLSFDVALTYVPLVMALVAFFIRTVSAPYTSLRPSFPYFRLGKPLKDESTPAELELGGT